VTITNLLLRPPPTPSPLFFVLCLTFSSTTNQLVKLGGRIPALNRDCQSFLDGQFKKN
jgi:hypothetical protein